jgi:uncharacterized protein
MMQSIGLLLIATLLLSCLPTIFKERSNEALAQQDIQTIKYRDLVIDLGNGVKTNAQLTIPAEGNGPFPGVLLVPGAGPADMNYTAGTNAKLFWQIAQYLSERGFVVLRYDKRGTGDNGTIINNNLWGNMTYDDLKQDAERAVNALIQQPEVDPAKISMIGHSEGGEIVTRVVTDNPTTKFNNIVLMAPRIQNPYFYLYYGFVGLPLDYAKQVLDKNHNGSFSLREASQDQIFQSMIGGNTSLMLTQSLSDGTKLVKSGYYPNNDTYININTELKPMLERRLENAFEAPKCELELPCPIYLESILNLKPTMSIIDNVSSSTGILILHGQNDSGSPVQQAFLLQQRLIGLNHSDHTLITYPDLGHHFFPSSQWTTESGPIPEYVLADLYSWLEAHSGISRSYVNTTADSALGT